MMTQNEVVDDQIQGVTTHSFIIVAVEIVVFYCFDALCRFYEVEVGRLSRMSGSGL